MSETENGFGRIYYIEIPATDIATSAAFYQTVFGWNVRERGDGHVAFDDGVGHVSGVWTTGRTPAADPGFRLYISVEDAEAAADRIKAAGATIESPPDMTVVDIVGSFRDPAGNLVCIHQYKPENGDA
ncbi:MAG TPA: VOC family protein [Thermomicrobiales bacterium]|nr:VOC family protein [Thermomicrobiales bacterium]